MKSIRNIVAEQDKSTANFSLSVDDVDKILYALAFTAGWGISADKKEYKQLWDNIAKIAKTNFTAKELEAIMPEKWNDYDLTTRGSFRRLS